jgi:hypothetical protein
MLLILQGGNTYSHNTNKKSAKPTSAPSGGGLKPKSTTATSAPATKSASTHQQENATPATMNAVRGGKGGETTAGHGKSSATAAAAAASSLPPPAPANADSHHHNQPHSQTAVGHSTALATELENANKEITNLRNALEESRKSYGEQRMDYEGLEKERDFYFDKLREIEILLQEMEDKGETSELTANIFKILYMTADGFDNANTAGGGAGAGGNHDNEGPVSQVESSDFIPGGGGEGTAQSRVSNLNRSGSNDHHHHHQQQHPSGGNHPHQVQLESITTSEETY